MQVADDDAPLARAPFHIVSRLRAELLERDIGRERLMDGVRHAVGLPERDESYRRRTSPTTIATSTASRSACS
jgi:hypothetical protein